uniref:Uncharacterized protein n=1 Tax=Anguilla anguilla TaxID=7936 RepID=A0A0E9PR34_ANGAN
MCVASYVVWLNGETKWPHAYRSTGQY